MIGQSAIERLSLMPSQAAEEGMSLQEVAKETSKPGLAATYMSAVRMLVLLFGPHRDVFPTFENAHLGHTPMLLVICFSQTLVSILKVVLFTKIDIRERESEREVEIGCSDFTR